MKTRLSRRQIANISHSRWLAYATAGAATAFAASPSLEAAIHYSGRLEFEFPRHSTFLKRFPLVRPSYNSLTFGHSFSNATFFVSTNQPYQFSFRAPSTGGHSYLSVSKLSFGQRIAAGQFGRPNYRGFLARGNIAGQWRDPGVGFIGFRFNVGAGLQYGWARVRMLGSDKQNGFKLIDYAWADPGEAIRAGQDGQHRIDAQGPDQGSLALLALGAVGLLAWRKSQSRTTR